MNRYIITILLLLCNWLFDNLLSAQSQIGTFPPQVHQQICQESTYTRYLGIFNFGDSTLSWNAEWTPGTYAWVTAEPMSGEVEPKDTLQVAFYFNSAGLELNNYYAYLQFNSNDPVHPDTVVLAMLHVQAITIIIEPENDSICTGCNTSLHTMVFGCSEEYQFNWTSNPPGFTSTEKSPVVSPSVNTTYTVHVTDGGGSAEQSVYIQVYGSSDIAENQSSSELSIFPNPFHDQFSLKFYTEIDGITEFKISDLSGRIVYKGNLRLIEGIGEYTIHPGRLRQGIYLLSIEGQNEAINSISVRTKVMVH
jgi:hypothetical protein